ncbi:cation transporter [bacterium]|nr:cation transporter [bacterium]
MGKPAEQASHANGNSRLALRIMWVALGVNLLAAVAKFLVAHRSGSGMILADAYYTALDSMVDVVLLSVMGFATRPPDSNHPYGHNKFEAIAVVGVAAAILLMFKDLAEHLVKSWRGQVVPHFDPLFVQVIGTAIIVGLALAAWQIVMARRLKSAGLAADGWFTLSGSALSSLSIVSLLASRSGQWWPDMLAACLASVALLFAGWRVGRDAMASLTDEARVDPQQVKDIVMAVPGVDHCHAVRSRGMPDYIQVDLNIHADPEMTLEQGHALAHRVEDAVLENVSGVVDVSVHVEPTARH